MAAYVFHNANLSVLGEQAAITWANGGPTTGFPLRDVQASWVAATAEAPQGVLVIQVAAPGGDQPTHSVIQLSWACQGTARSVATWLQQVAAHYGNTPPAAPPAASAPNDRWIDRAVAGARVAANTTRSTGRQVVADLDAQYGHSDGYRSFRQSMTEAKSQTKTTVVEALRKRTEAIDKAAATESGAAIGDASRQFAAAVNRVPVLSAVSDAVQARHGVGPLHRHFLENPQDPIRALLLAEALFRVRQDVFRYRVVRSVTSPTYLLISQSLIATTAMGSGDVDPTEILLLKRAFRAAKARVRRNPGDAEALHVVARVYLAQRHLDHAERFAKVAFLADPKDPRPLLTLARVHLETGQHEQARLTAERAIARGSSFGNEILARLVLTTAQDEAAVSEYQALRSRVSDRDKIEYLGVAVSGNDWWSDFKTRQKQKLDNIVGGLEAAHA